MARLRYDIYNASMSGLQVPGQRHHELSKSGGTRCILDRLDCGVSRCAEQWLNMSKTHEAIINAAKSSAEA